MNNILENISEKNLSLQKGLDLEVSENLANFVKITQNTINSAADYVIKSLNISEAERENLNSVRKLLKQADFKDVVNTAISASIKFGLEFAKKKFPILKTIDGVKDMSIQGGVSTLLSSGIDILANKYFKGNLMSDEFKMFFDDIKSFFKSSSFVSKLEQGINRINNNIIKFKDLCKKWYESYEKFNLKEMNDISDTINKFKYRINCNSECLKEGDIIKNMTALVNNKMEKLSKTQLEVCANI